MRVIYERPPLFDEIAAVFPDARQPGVLFCFGSAIYAPGPPRPIRRELVAHEQVHCDRQGVDIEGWWRRYLADEAFRLEEELPAHVAEFRSLCEQYRFQWISARAMRRTFATAIGRKLAAPLYGRMISAEDAKRAILAA